MRAARGLRAAAVGRGTPLAGLPACPPRKGGGESAGADRSRATPAPPRRRPGASAAPEGDARAGEALHDARPRQRGRAHQGGPWGGGGASGRDGADARRDLLAAHPGTGGADARLLRVRAGAGPPVRALRVCTPGDAVLLPPAVPHVRQRQGVSAVRPGGCARARHRLLVRPRAPRPGARELLPGAAGSRERPGGPLTIRDHR
mmetsp:Transcript_62634/g.148298  ORF Transcript_62634/g.148298 Transcript_62634/m.148298 type:complete len:203 (+) Transcript_62634:196-804(+)